MISSTPHISSSFSNSIKHSSPKSLYWLNKLQIVVYSAFAISTLLSPHKSYSLREVTAYPVSSTIDPDGQVSIVDEKNYNSKFLNCIESLRETITLATAENKLLESWFNKDQLKSFSSSQSDYDYLIQLKDIFEKIDSKLANALQHKMMSKDGFDYASVLLGLRSMMQFDAQPIVRNFIEVTAEQVNKVSNNMWGQHTTTVHRIEEIIFYKIKTEHWQAVFEKFDLIYDNLESLEKNLLTVLKEKGLGVHEAIVGFMMGIDSKNAILYGNFIDFQYSRNTVFTLIPEMFKSQETFKSVMTFLSTVNSKINSNSKFCSFPIQTGFFQSLIHVDNSTLSSLNISPDQHKNFKRLSNVVSKYYSKYIKINPSDPNTLPPHTLSDGSLLRRSFNVESMQPIMQQFEEANKVVKACMSEL